VYTVSQIIGIIAIVTVAAHKRFTGFIAKHTFPVAALMELALVLSGICTYRNIFSICLIVGAFCQTTSFWLIDEKVIRQISFWCSPFWITYNNCYKGIWTCSWQYVYNVFHRRGYCKI